MRTVIGAAPAADGDHATLHFLVSDHQHVGDLVLFRFADLKSDFLIADIRFDSVARAP